MQEEFSHAPVLHKEIAELLLTDLSGTYLDATVGMGGHSSELLMHLSPDGRIIGLDWDPEMVAIARKNLTPFKEKAKVLEGNFADVTNILGREGISSLSGALFDLGVSSLHFDKPSRGFSFRHDGPLDMRINPDNSLTAETILNTWPFEQMDHLLRVCGEERFSWKIAKAIVEKRGKNPFKTTGDLRQVVEGLFSGRTRRNSRIHPATRTFMALRVTVNYEFDNLMRGIEKTSALLRKGGRMAVISFHSLEDRIVKETFRSMIAVGGWKWTIRKPVKPSQCEITLNSRARSAKLRVIEKI
ncbi:MAG: 16S rRNA (cytosine(1402)-N(4))-methyltransferase RsmH [bacterium]